MHKQPTRRGFPGQPVFGGRVPPYLGTLLLRSSVTASTAISVAATAAAAVLVVITTIDAAAAVAAGRIAVAATSSPLPIPRFERLITLLVSPRAKGFPLFPSSKFENRSCLVWVTQPFYGRSFFS